MSDTADTTYELSVLPDTKKKNPALPKHVLERSTLRHMFTTCLDIRESPKKVGICHFYEETETKS